MKNFIIVSILILTANVQIHSQAFEWANSIGGTSSNDEGKSIAVDASGNVYTVGYFVGTVDFDPGPAIFNIISAGSWDIFISKLDASGNFVWAKSIGGTGQDRGNSIALDAGGNVYLTGNYLNTVDFDPGVGVTNLTSVNGSDCYILKLDPSGNFLWVKNLGGSSAQEGAGIVIDPTGFIYTTGHFFGTTDFDPGPGTFNLTPSGIDAFVCKLDATGNFVWAIGMGGTSTIVFDIDIDAISNVFITGYFDGSGDFDPGAGVTNLTSAGNQDIFIMKVDASGNFGWAAGIGGSGTDNGYGITVSASGNVYATGRFDGSVDFDPGAGIFNLTSGGVTDSYVVKFDVLGNMVWANRIGGSNNVYAYSIDLDASENVYSTGSYQGITDFDPGIGTNNLSPVNCADIYVSILDAAGNFVGVKSMGGSSCDQGNSIEIDALGNIYTTGYYNGTSDFDPAAAAYNLTSEGFGDVFISKLGPAFVGIEQNKLTTFSLYPNPTSNSVTLEFSKVINKASISVINMLGDVIYTIQTNSLINRINLPETKGVYLIQVLMDEEVSVHKIIKN